MRREEKVTLVFLTHGYKSKNSGRCTGDPLSRRRHQKLRIKVKETIAEHFSKVKDIGPDVDSSE